MGEGSGGRVASVWFGSNTPNSRTSLAFWPFFIKSKQNARDIPKTGGKISVFRGTPDFEKVKNDGKIAKTGKTENPGRGKWQKMVVSF